MKICVDVGNTQVKIGLFKNDELLFSLSFNTDPKLSSDEIYMTIKSLIDSKNIDIKEENIIVYSSVVPLIDVNLKEALIGLFKGEILVVEQGIKTGLMMKVDNPSEVGSDLITDLVAAKEKYSYPSLVIDLGTATKMLLLDKNGIFSSCLIIPGLSLSAETLSKRAALLPEVSLEKVKPLLQCKKTSDAMKSGIVLGHYEMIKGLALRYEKELGYPVKKILTGGASKYILEFCKDYMLDKDLSLYGLLFILNKNLERK